MAYWADLLGKNLADNNGNIYDTANELADKTVLLYFSASWCPPCQQFTPKLVSVYQKLLAKNTPVEIIFVSWDKTEQQFKDYFKKMPWKTVSADFSLPRTILDRKYKVNSIPTLISFTKDGEIINNKARSLVMRDMEGAEFPWYPKKVTQLFGESLINKNGQTFYVEQQLKGNTFGVLFGGKWAGQKFISFAKHLTTVSEILKGQGKEFKVLYVTLDKTQRDHRDSLALLPDDVLTVPFGDPCIGEAFEQLVTANQIPYFVMVDGEGEVINQNAYLHAFLDKTGEFFPWGPRAVEPVELASNADINNNICAIAYLDPSSDVQAAFKQFGEEHHEAFKRGEKLEVKFFYTDGKHETAVRLQSAFRLTSFPAVLLLKLPKFYITTDLSPASLDPLIDSICDGSFADQMSSL